MKFWNILNSLILFYSNVAFGITPHNLTPQEETRNKIVVLDTGLDAAVASSYRQFLCKDNHYDSTDTTINDTHGHGTNVAGIIFNYINPEKTCLIIVKYTTGGKNKSEISDLINGLEVINKINNVRIVNFSSGGGGHHEKEKFLINQLIQKAVYFITAAGNENIDLNQLCDQFPACYGFLNVFFRVVANGKDPKHRFPTTNYNGPVTDWRNGKEIKGFGITMTGSSQSTAILSGEIGRSLEK